MWHKNRINDSLVRKRKQENNIEMKVSKENIEQDLFKKKFSTQFIRFVTNIKQQINLIVRNKSHN